MSPRGLACVSLERRQAIGRIGAAASRAMFARTREERFWAKVEMLPDAPGCWLWTGALQAPTAGINGTGGYGVLGRDGRTLFAHRVAYEMVRGPIPAGLVLDHLCREHSCVNPAHLEPVTERINILRGVSCFANNARRTHCTKGHPLDGITTRRSGERQRYCRRCNLERVLAHDRQKRAEKRAAPEAGR